MAGIEAKIDYVMPAGIAAGMHPSACYVRALTINLQSYTFIVRTHGPVHNKLTSAFIFCVQMLPTQHKRQDLKFWKIWKFREFTNSVKIREIINAGKIR